MEKRYRVTLTIEEHKDLQKLVSVGKAAARKLMRARALLLANQSVDGPANSQAVCGEGFGSGPETGKRDGSTFYSFFRGLPRFRKGGSFSRDSILFVQPSLPYGRLWVRQCNTAASSADVCGVLTHAIQSLRR